MTDGALCVDRLLVLKKKRNEADGERARRDDGRLEVRLVLQHRHLGKHAAGAGDRAALHGDRRRLVFGREPDHRIEGGRQLLGGLAQAAPHAAPPVRKLPKKQKIKDNNHFLIY